MAKKDSAFLAMQKMSDENMDISLSLDMTNFVRQQKKGGGLVTFGVASPTFDHLINQAGTGVQTHYAMMFVVNAEQYEKVKKELSEA